MSASLSPKPFIRNRKSPYLAATESLTGLDKLYIGFRTCLLTESGGGTMIPLDSPHSCSKGSDFLLGWREISERL
jgi:hypothetical protein